jgi:hypothetical protein
MHKTPAFAKRLCALRRYGNDGRRPPASGDGHWKQTAPFLCQGWLRRWRGNPACAGVLSDRVKLCGHDSRLVSVAKPARKGRDEPLVEASIVGNTLSEGTSYPSIHQGPPFYSSGRRKGVPMSVAVVSRCWPHRNPARAGTERYAGIKSSFSPLSFPLWGRWPKAGWGFQARFHACWHASARR